LLHANRRTDSHEEYNNHFSSIVANVPKMRYILLLLNLALDITDGEWTWLVTCNIRGGVYVVQAAA